MNTRAQVEQAFIDGSVEGSPIDHDGNTAPAPAHDRGQHHYRITCVVCGERGTLRVSIDPALVEPEPLP